MIDHLIRNIHRKGVDDGLNLSTTSPKTWTSHPDGFHRLLSNTRKRKVVGFRFIIYARRHSPAILTTRVPPRPAPPPRPGPPPLGPGPRRGALRGGILCQQRSEKANGGRVGGGGTSLREMKVSLAFINDAGLAGSKNKAQLSRKNVLKNVIGHQTPKAVRW